ncbi:FAD-dependent monooxygenase [Nocardia sp. CA2R105]|uniref:FAD-dependent monooxygenase n=1 Tax=Nocardia coffeae TaxID=2873381 RepID=UPI001CA6707B|nr:FAD-dependent monooxygenase [Nocardia coffeae]MBY8860619.1 FAD-dependent monooxygenase [Nocardia coffeae]
MTIEQRAEMPRTPVLIVGGSIVGVSAALFLAARGIVPVLVEKHTGISNRLRAKVFYPRTMEAYRSVGADKDICARQAALPPADHAAQVTSLAGPELRRWQLPAAADMTAVSPCPSALLAQSEVEEVVRAHARAAGADLRWGHRLIGFEDRGEHVCARIADPDGREYRLAAEYLLAADGQASEVRERLGIGRIGEPTIAHVMEIGYTADLRAVLAGRRLAMAWTELPERAYLTWRTGYDRGVVSVNYDPSRTDPASFDGPRNAALVSRALGIPAAQLSITGARSWQMGGWVAERYRAGRVFLLGDAAHVTPPAGGFGANTGIQDAWNLSAKLVSVLRGDADPALLEDYEPERRGVGESTVAQAMARAGHGSGTELPSEAAVAIGYRYPMSGTDPALPPADEPQRWRGEVGTRLVHRPLPGDSGSSTLDLVREGRYLLLVGANGRPWLRAARALDRYGAFLDAVTAPAECTAGQEDSIGIGDRGALLVRPDHVIAWRADEDGGDALARLSAAIWRVLTHRLPYPSE